ncbi:Flp pilus assembly protein CpaB [Paracoccaceae bacterium Fryx2]|nr:Flp pilus assembly protein CpaB [Paracoccaceae bacterium Fryx2]
MLRAAIILVALGFGGLAAWLVISQKASPVEAGPAIAVPIPTMDVLVAATDVPAGAALIAENLRWQAWPSSGVGPSFITRAARPDAEAELRGMTVRSGFLAGEPVHESRLLGMGAGFLSVMLESGMRAVAVKVNAETTAGGFILPNDHVDVMQTINVIDGGGAGTIVSQVLLSNVRVLAIDQMAARQDSDSLVGKTATLELFPDQVEKVTTAAVSGAISLVLRPLADNADLAEPPAPPVMAPPPSRTIRIYRSGGLELMKLDAAATGPVVRP